MVGPGVVPSGSAYDVINQMRSFNAGVVKKRMNKSNVNVPSGQEFFRVFFKILE